MPHAWRGTASSRAACRRRRAPARASTWPGSRSRRPSCARRCVAARSRSASPRCCAGRPSATRGCRPLLDAVVDYLPSPSDVPAVRGVVPGSGAPVERAARDDEPFAALVFKIMTDPFVGHLAFLRVYAGRLSSGEPAWNATRGTRERLGRLLRMHANKREEIEEAGAGDIAAVVGLRRRLDRRHDLRRAAPRAARVDGLPRAGPPPGDRAEDEGRSGAARRGSGQADPRGSDASALHTDPETGQTLHRRDGRAAPRDPRRSPAARVRGRGQRRHAAGGLPRDGHAARPRPRDATCGRRAGADSTAT